MRVEKTKTMVIWKIKLEVKADSDYQKSQDTGYFLGKDKGFVTETC